MTDVEASRSSLWRNGSFNAYWGASVVSVLGDTFSELAAPLLVLQATGSIATAGLLTGAATTAMVVSGLFAGVLVDRLDRRALMVGADLGRMILLGLVPLLWVLGERQVWVLFVVLPLASALGMVHQVASVTALRSLVPVEDLTAANGRFFAGISVAYVAGPAAAGAVSGWLGPAAAMAVDAASFGICGAILLLVRLPPRPEAPEPGRPLAEFVAGARFLFQQPVLRAMTVMLTVFILLTHGIDDVVIYRLKHGLAASDGTVGAVLAVAALGGLCGSLAVAGLRRWLGFGVCWSLAVAIAGIGTAALCLSRGDVMIALILAVASCCQAVAGICSMSLRQEVTPEHLLGRVTSAFWTIHYSLGGVGAAGLTWLAQHHGTVSAFLLAGLGCVVIAGASLLTPIRGVAPPVPQGAEI